MTRGFTVKQLTLASLLACIALEASASLVIRPAPVENGAHHNRRAAKVFSVSDQANTRVTMITPTLEHRELALADGRFKFKPTGMDNYHAMVATNSKNNTTQTAIRYIYSFGKPSGHSPSELTGLTKAELEIIPDPLPREHWHYKSNYPAVFKVHFEGKPLANARVSLATSQASILKGTTDSEGRIEFTVPDDFKDVKPGRRANKPGEILLHVKHQHNDKHYATWLSADYRVDPSHWRNTQLGALVAGGGFLVGAFITGLGFRQKKPGAHKPGAHK